MSQFTEQRLETNPTEFHITENRKLNRIYYELTKWSIKWMGSAKFFKGKIEENNEFNYVLIDEILKAKDAKIFLDSSKVINHALYMSLYKGFDFYLIQLVRDPRAQVNSAMRINKWNTTEATQKWIKEMKRNQEILDIGSINYMTLKYHELCRNPEKEMIRVFDFIQEDNKRFSLDFRAPPQHIIGNRNVRLGKDKTIVERTDWKDNLSAAQIESITKMTKEYEHFYG